MKKNRLGYIWRRIKDLRTDQRGVTLAELMVSFALTAMLMVSAGQVAASGASVYMHVKSQSYGRQVSSTVLEKIVGSLQTARADSLVIEKDEEGDQERDGVRYYSRTDGQKRIFVNSDGRLEMEGVDADWQFDEKVYMNYHIKKLTFEQPAARDTDYGEGVVKIELTIQDDAYGEYTRTEYVECD